MLERQKKLVWDFQEAMNQPQHDNLEPGLQRFRALRISLIKEELQELQNALLQNDDIEVLDALIDSMYVLLGTVNYHGFSNFNSFMDFETEIEYSKTVDYVDLMYKLVKEITPQYVIGSFTFSELLNFCCSYANLILSMLKTLESRGIYQKNVFEPAFLEVHNSNMSKLDNNGKAIFRPDGKVLKSNNYWKPELSKYLTIKK